MKIESLLAFGAFLALSAEAAPVPEDRPGFVRVDWSEKGGEKWTVEGLADREANRPMTKDTVFAICSNTKPVNSVLVLTFVEEGLLNLDDPVSKYIPEFAVTAKADDKVEFKVK